jgi:uncharacterized protein
MYQPRFYRHWVKNKDLVAFNVIVEETDCCISATANLAAKARPAILKYRAMLKKYIAAHPVFLTTLEPFAVEEDAPLIVQAMAAASARANVGPMAAVAGAIAQFTGADLAKYSPEIIIENGGDIYLNSRRERIVGVFAGQSPLSGKIGLQIAARDTPLGISTSSGTVGHSLSFGKADSVLVLAEDAVLSDAAATAIGNLILTADDFPKGIEYARKISGVSGVLIIKDADLAAWGAIHLVETQID